MRDIFAKYEFKEQQMKKEISIEEFNAMRQKCTVYTRVMGYHRPVESFNVGKTGEHKQRKQFSE